MSFTESDDTPPLAPPDQDRLLALARDSITRFARTGRRLSITPDQFNGALLDIRASFVSIHNGDQLRGCIGHLEARQALCLDVNENAYAAASKDRRFNPVQASELPDLNIEISILSPPARLDVVAEAQLLARIRPGIDGLILQTGRHRATFLPVVWQHLPEPVEFVRQLKLKAGLPAEYWSDDVECLVYQANNFAES